MPRIQSKNRLGDFLQVYLAVKNLDLRTVAAEIGVSASTLMRVTHGRTPNAETFAKIMNWLIEKI